MKSKMLGVAILLSLSMVAFAQKRFLLIEISDSAGQPVVDADIELTVDQAPVINKQTKTDKKGRASFFDFPPGDVNVKINKAGYLEFIHRYRTSQNIREKFALTIYKEDEALDDLSDQPTISGKIIDTAGNPIPGVTLTVTIEGTPYEKVHTLGDDGTFTVHGLKNNIVTLSAKKFDYREQINKVTVREDPVTIPEFALKTLDEVYAEMGIERPKEEEETPEEKATKLFNLAVEPYQQGRFTEAEDLAKQALDQNPEMVEPMKLLVFANLKTEDWQDVLTYSQKYLEKKPDDTNIMKAAAQAAELLGDKKQLAELKGKLKDKGEVTVGSLLNEMINHLNANDDAAASKVIDEIFAMDKNNARAYFELGKIKLREYDFDEAIRNLKLYLKHAKADDKFRKEATDLIVTLSE